MKCAWIAVAALSAAACASPQTARPVVGSSELVAEQQRQSQFVLQSRARDYQRVYDIAERLYRANVELCHRTAPVVGVRLENLSDYPREFRDAARTLWGLSDRPRISWIASDSPAAAAGLQVGDEIMSINGRGIEANRRSTRQATTQLREAAEAGVVALQVRRGLETHSLNVRPATSCAYQFQVVDADDLNAAADGRTIYINRGMLRFVRSDEELALILGHELAHNAMRHIEAAQQNALMGTIGGALIDVLAAAGGVNTGGAFADAGGDIGRMMFSQEFESEADYVGMYFTARAGYDISEVEDFWRRMAAEHPRGIRFAYTHPNTAERYLTLAAARDEITAKRAQGLALRPNRRGEHVAPEPPPVTPISAPSQPQPAPSTGSEPSDADAGEPMAMTPTSAPTALGSTSDPESSASEAPGEATSKAVTSSP